MENKKIIIFITIILIIVGIAIYFAFYFFGVKKTETAVSPTQNSSTQLPYSEPSNQIVQNNTNQEQINSKFQNSIGQFSTTDSEKSGFEIKNYKYNDGKAIPLTDFSRSIGFTICPAVKNILAEDRYHTYQCKNTEGKMSFGVSFSIKKKTSLPDLYTEGMALMKSCESTLLKDIQPVIFPSSYFPNLDINQKIIFSNGKYRYVNMALADNSIVSIDYAVMEDSIVIAGSLECMEKISSFISPIEP